ncbi:MAG: hypothetical protein ACXWQO_10445, partial [Bdellovibrionota bacterium]
RAIRGVRAAEMKATEILDQMKRDFFGTVDKHLGKEDPHLRKFTYESGDDTIVLPSKPLTHAQERAIVADLAEKPNTVRTTINPSRYADNGKVIPPGLRSEYVVRAEKMEKDLRKVMAGPFTSQELDNSQIVVKMRPRSDGTKSVGIYLGGKNSVEIAQKMESWTKNFLKEQKIRTDFVETISRPKNITEAALAASEETAERLRNAENSLGRELTPRQQNAVIRAHEVGEGKAGKAINGDMPAAKGNYSLSQIREKERILRNEGFTTGEIRSLMDEGVVGSEGGLRKPASSATSDGAGIKLSSDLKSGDSRVVSSREEAYLIEEDLMPKGIAENRDNWLKSGESSDFEDYGKSVAPEESKSEFKRLADLKNPANMPASPGAAYYQQQVNYTKGQLELLSNFHNEDAFGGLEKVMDQQFKLEEELKKSQMALKNARAQGRP